MSKWSVIFKDGRKIIIETKKTPEELIKRHEKVVSILETAKRTGKWWETWQREEVVKSLEKDGILDIVIKAIKGLRRIYTEDWFKKDENERHPMWPILINPALTDNPVRDNPLTLFEFITLGYSAEMLGDQIDPNLLEDLRRRENFYSRAFELRVKAFLKSLNPPAILEEELIDRVHKVPDARWVKYDFEIKYLEESEFDRRFRIAQERINEKIREVFSSSGFTGRVTYNIELGSVRSIKEFEDRVSLVIDLLASLKGQIQAEEEEGSISLSKGNIQIEIHFIQDDFNSIAGFIGVKDPFPLEFRRISRVIDDASEKVRDKPLIVIIGTPKPLEFYLVDEAMRIVTSYFIFSPYLTPKDEKVVEEIKGLIASTTSKTTDNSIIAQKIEEIGRKAEKLERKIIEKFEKLSKIKEVWLFVRIPIFEAKEIIKKEPIFFGAIVIENPFYGLSLEEIIKRNIEGRKLFEEKLRRVTKREKATSTPKMIIGVTGKFIYV